MADPVIISEPVSDTDEQDRPIPDSKKQDQLTEEDIFRMKHLVDPRLLGTSEMQSVVSVADSMSNFGEHVPDNDSAGEEDKTNGSNADNEDPNENVDFDAFDGGVIHARNGKFAFNRTRDETAVFPEDVVTVLSNPIKETGSGCAEQLEIIDADVFRAQFAATKVFLIGTAHFSRASQQDVLHTIKATQPDMVFIELCPQRMNVLEINEEVWMRDAQDFSQGRIFSLFKELGFAQGLLQSLLFITSAHIAKELGMPPGGEFRSAFHGYKMVPCSRLCFGDRPFSVTIKRALGSLSFFQRLRFLYHLFLSIDTKITAEDVERVKQRDLLGEILLEMAGDFPLLAKIFIDERDLYMTDVLHKLVANITMEKMIVSATDGIPYQPVNIVAVVGMGHVPGIVKNWENFDIDVAELMTIPEPSTAAKVFKVAVRLTVCGAVLYGVYRVGTFTFGKIRPLL